MSKRKIKAVMFDLDGTLLDTIGDIADTMNALAVKYGIPGRSEEEYMALVGHGALQLVKDIFPPSFDRDAVLAEYKASLRKNSKGRTGTYGGIPEMLTRLSENSLPLAVLTNKPQETAEEVCLHYLGNWEFTHIRGQVDGIPPKPDAGQALEIIGDWNIDPCECLYLGDTSTDMETARNGGFFAVGCTWGFRDREELESSGADAIVDLPEEVPGLLNL